MSTNFETIAMALDHHQAGRRDVAEGLYRQVLSAEPTEPTALYLYGLFNFEGGNVDAAAELFKSLIAVRPDHAEAHVALANLRHWQGAHGAAIDGYRRALAIAPDHAAALVERTNALRENGDLAEAVEAGREAAARLTDSAPARMALGAALLAVDDLDAAAQAYRAAADLAPTAIEPRMGVATTLLQAGRPDEALAVIDAALTLQPNNGDTWFLLGTTLNQLGRTEEAVAALTRAAAIDPTRAAVQLNLGNAFVELDKAEDAATCLQQALAIDPTVKEAHASLSSVYLMAGEVEAAEHHARLALELDPDMAAAHQNLASILAGKGDAAQARWHRDQVYGRQNLFVEPAARPEARVLILTTSESGNVPHRHLLPRSRFTRINWFIEYATPGQVLPAYDAVFNAVGDADLAGPTLTPMRAFLAASGARVINEPAKVMRTGRQNIPLLLGDIAGVVIPQVARLTAAGLARDGLAACAAQAGLAAPLLARPSGAHGGQGLVRALTPEDLAEIRVAAGEDAYVTAYHDYRSADGWHRKYRMIFVDRRPFPYHLAISKDWLVHYESAEMPEDPMRVAEERRFIEDPQGALGPAAMSAVQEIGRRMDLDYCGVDFTVLPDGRVLVFEANATMLVHPEDEKGPLAHKNAAVAAICEAFQALIGG